MEKQKSYTFNGITLTEKEIAALLRCERSKSGIAPSGRLVTAITEGLAFKFKHTRMSGAGGMPSVWTVEKVKITPEGKQWLDLFTAAITVQP